MSTKTLCHELAWVAGLGFAFFAVLAQLAGKDITLAGIALACLVAALLLMCFGDISEHQRSLSHKQSP